MTSAWSFRASNAPALIAGGSNRYEFGVGLHTRGANGIYFCRIIEADRAGQQVLIENLPQEGRNREITATRGWVESAVVHSLLRGRDVQEWTARPSRHFILPHDPSNLDKVLKDSVLREHYPKARKWLRRHYDILSARAAPPTRSWKMDGDDWCRVDGALGHMDARHLVVVREQQARPAAAVVDATMDFDLNRRSTPLIDHKLMFCSVPSRAEALYLVAMINSTPMQDLLVSFANSIAISPTTLRRLPIPDFDLEVDAISRIVDLAIDIASEPDPRSRLAGERSNLDKLSLQVVESDPELYKPQPRRTAKRRKTVLDSADSQTLF